MYVFVELWSARPTWLALSPDARADYLTQVASAVATLADAGIESLYWAANDADTPHRADYDFLAIWKLPDAAAVAHFEATVDAAGWYTYFDQLNARGKITAVEPILARLAQLH